MTSWQKRLRVGLAVFGILFAGLVYRSIGERRVAPPVRPAERTDRNAEIETKNAEMQQVRADVTAQGTAILARWQPMLERGAFAAGATNLAH